MIYKKIPMPANNTVNAMYALSIVPPWGPILQVRDSIVGPGVELGANVGKEFVVSCTSSL